MTLNDPRFAGFQRPRAVRDLAEGETHLVAVRDHIATYGWHVQAVFAGPARLGWVYTIGFGDSLDHPDMVVYGLSDEVATVLLNGIGDALAEGRTFRLGERYGDFLGDIDIEFRETLPRWSPAHFGKANDWYGSYPTMWQVVLPDRENRFPGDPGEESSVFQLQLWSEGPAPRQLKHEHAPFEVDEAWEAVVPDVLGGHETGWEELVLVTQGANPDRFVVVSVPFVDHVGFGDEVRTELVDGQLHVVEATQLVPIATVRMAILRSEDRQLFDEFIDAAEANGILWESPAPSWIFFAVPHDKYEWFNHTAEPLRSNGTASFQTARPPSP